MEAKSAKFRNYDICSRSSCFYFISQCFLLCRFRRCCLTAATSTLPSRPPAAHPGSPPTWAIVKTIMITASTITAITAASAIRDRRLREAVFWNEAFWKSFFWNTTRNYYKNSCPNNVPSSAFRSWTFKPTSKPQNGPIFWILSQVFVEKYVYMSSLFSKMIQDLQVIRLLIYFYRYFCKVWNADVSLG